MGRSARTANVNMLTMSTGTGFVRRTDAMCVGSAVKLLEHVTVCCTTESARYVKHILVQSQSGDVMACNC